MTAFSDSDIINYVVRMVVPMRREFGRNLDVQQFMHDSTYAKLVIDEALTSQDTRLLDYARYVSQRLLSPRIAVGAPTAGAPQPAPAAAPASPAAPPVQATETLDEKALRERVMRKYTSGLR